MPRLRCDWDIRAFLVSAKSLPPVRRTDSRWHIDAVAIEEMGQLLLLAS